MPPFPTAVNESIKRVALAVQHRRLLCLAATIASCISIASACASFAIYFDLIPHTLHIGSIVNSSAEYELS